jgi:hypothetical protein
MGALTAALAGCSSDDDQEATDNSDDDTPTDETPAEDTPADDTPSEDTPADDTPAEDTPAEDTSAEDTPTDDPSTDTFDPASELPYGQWLTTDQNGLFFAYANLDNYPDEAVGGSTDSSDPAVDDPLALYPLVIGGGAVGVGQLALSFAGLGQAIRPTGTSDSTVSEVTVTNESIIAE